MPQGKYKQGIILVMNYSQITPYLYVGSTPHRKDYERLSKQGIKLAINMRIDYFWFSRKPLFGINIVWVPTVDVIFLPIKAEKLLPVATQASRLIQNKQSVLSFCRMGRHRSVAMACAILITQGYTAKQAMELVKLKRPVADPYISHIANTINHFEHLWLQKNKPR